MVKKMSVEETLTAISKSLEEKPAAAPRKLEKKAVGAADLAQALLKLPEISQKLSLILEEKQRQVDSVSLIGRIDLDVQEAVSAARQNLKQTGMLQQQLKKRLDGFDVLEAKWSRLIERVSSVLDELEQVLKQM